MTTTSASQLDVNFSATKHGVGQCTRAAVAASWPERVMVLHQSLHSAQCKQALMSEHYGIRAGLTQPRRQAGLISPMLTYLVVGEGGREGGCAGGDGGALSQQRGV